MFPWLIGLFFFAVMSIRVVCNMIRSGAAILSAVPQALKETAGFRTLREDRRMQENRD